MPSPNQRIGEYLLDRQIGRGGFGEVWLARHHLWPQRLVAVKIPTDPAYVRDLQREGAAVQALEHPNIVRAIGADPFADPPYLITEYVPGTSLRPLIERREEGRRALAPADAVAILSQVLRGLAYAHGKGVVHRDVKPENILIHERTGRDGYGVEGLVKLTDFGLGHASDALRRGGDGGSIAFSGATTATAARVVGSEQYMAPEQRDGSAVDGRADLFACGVILFEMLTGHRPVGTELPTDVEAELPKHLDEVYRRSYARIERRFPSAEEFLKALTPPGAVNGNPKLAAPSIAPPLNAAAAMPAASNAAPAATLPTLGETPVANTSPASEMPRAEANRGATSEASRSTHSRTKLTVASTTSAMVTNGANAAAPEPGLLGRLFMAAFRGVVSGFIALGGLGLVAGIVIVALWNAINRLDNRPPPGWRAAAVVVGYSLAAGAAWGAAAGAVAGLLARPSSILTGGIVARTVRSGVGLLLGGGLGFGSLWLLFEPAPRAVPAAAVAATVGGLAGAVLGARASARASYSRPSLDRPVRVPTAYYPGRGRDKGPVAKLATTAKVVLVTFVVITVGQYLLKWTDGVIGCSVVLVILGGLGFFGYHYLHPHHRH